MIDGDKNKDGKISFEEFVYVSAISELPASSIWSKGLLLDKAKETVRKGWPWPNSSFLSTNRLLFEDFSGNKQLFGRIETSTVFCAVIIRL